MWGAATVREPREGDVVTESSLVAALRATRLEPAASVEVEAAISIVVGEAEACVAFTAEGITVEPGSCERADLTVRAGPEIRDLLAGQLSAREAVVRELVSLQGNEELFEVFAASFAAPYA